jgi:hypothetical protein
MQGARHGGFEVLGGLGLLALAERTSTSPAVMMESPLRPRRASTSSAR